MNKYFYKYIKIIKGFGVITYVRDKMNLFDGFIVILSEIDLFLIDALSSSNSKSSAFSAFRTIRIIRIFRVLRVTRLIRYLKKNDKIYL